MSSISRARAVSASATLFLVLSIPGIPALGAGPVEVLPKVLGDQTTSGAISPEYAYYEPVTAFHPTSGYARVWTHFTPYVDSIYTVFHPAGLTEGGGGSLRTDLPTPLSNAGPGIGLGFDSAGILYAGWTLQEFPWEPDPEAMVVRRFDQNGTPLDDGRFIGEGYSSSLLVDADGEHTAIWIDESGDRLARRFAPNGDPLTPVTTLPEWSAFGQDTANDAEGNFVVTWSPTDHTLCVDSGSPCVLARRFSNALVPLGASFQVNTTTDGNQLAPSIDMLPDGRFVIVWANEADPARDVRMRLYDAGGTAVTDEIVVVETSSARGADVAFYSLSGELVVTFGRSSEVFARFFSATGEPLGQEVLISEPEPPGSTNIVYSYFSPVVAATTGGDIAVDYRLRIDYLDIGNHDDSVARRYLGIDEDDDGSSDTWDNCVGVTNVGQWDYDEDGVGDACELCLGDDSLGDSDLDGVCDDLDCDPSSQDGAFVDACGVCGGDNGTCALDRGVNSNGAGSLPAVASSADGSFLVVWQGENGNSVDGDGTSIQAQKYDSAGDPVGGQVQINAYTTGDQSRPAVAAAADGSFLVVWESEGSAGDDNDGLSVQGRFVDAAGQPQGGDIQLNAYTSAGQLHARVAAQPSGDFVVVWASGAAPDGEDNEGYSIRGVRLNAQGQTLGSESQLNLFASDNQARPDVATHPDGGGEFVVTWADQVADAYLVAHRRFTSDGQPVAGETVSPYEPGIRLGMRAAMEADGGYALTWTHTEGDGSGRSVWMQTFDSEGEPRQDARRVNAVAEMDQRDSFPLWIGGRPLMLWQSEGSLHEPGSTPSVQGRWFTPQGGLLDQAFPADSPASDRHLTPVAASLPDQGFVVVWTADRGTGQDIELRRFTGPLFFYDGFESGDLSAWDVSP